MGFFFLFILQFSSIQRTNKQQNSLTFSFFFFFFLKGKRRDSIVRGLSSYLGVWKPEEILCRRSRAQPEPSALSSDVGILQVSQIQSRTVFNFFFFI